jgi:hypothetical protein
MKGLLDIVMWLIIGSLVVLAVTNAGGFSQAVGAVGGFVQGESRILAGK